MSTHAMVTPIGRVTLEPVDPSTHADLLHGWVTDPKSTFWGMQGWTPQRTRAALDEIAASPHEDQWLGRVDGRPTFLTETYDPAHGVLAAHYPVEPGDLGMHVLVAPSPTRAHGLTSQVFRAVMHFCFRDPAVTRVVVEPDAHNHAIHAKNAAAGFVVDQRISLSDKDALLSFCTVADFAASEMEHGDGRDRTPQLAHLEPGVMGRAHRHVAAKALGEFTHERLLAPVATEDGRWSITAGEARYTFAATRHEPEHWRVDPASIERVVDGAATDVDALTVVSDLHEVLGIP